MYDIMPIYDCVHVILVDSGKYHEEESIWKTVEGTTRGVIDPHHRPQSQDQRVFQRLSGPTKSKPQTLFWTILRKEALEMVWKHEEKGCVRCPQQLQVDARSGNNDPYLMFRLHPYGLFEDKGKNMTLFVKMIIPDDCPPIHPSAKLYLTVRVYTVEGVKRKQLHVHHLNPKVNSCVVYVPKFMSHKEVLNVDWKELDVQISASTGEYIIKLYGLCTVKDVK